MIRRTSSALAAILAIVLSGCSEVASPPPTLQTTTYRVGGMHCEGCAAAIATKVGQVDGVASCNVDLEREIAVVEATPGSDQQVKDAIARLGYKVDPPETEVPG